MDADLCVLGAARPIVVVALVVVCVGHKLVQSL